MRFETRCIGREWRSCSSVPTTWPHDSSPERSCHRSCGRRTPRDFGSSASTSGRASWTRPRSGRYRQLNLPTSRSRPCVGLPSTEPSQTSRVASATPTSSRRNRRPRPRRRRAGVNVVTLERFGPAGHALVVLADDHGHLSIGKSPDNDLVIDGDPAVSKVHALLERVSSAWCVSDLGSTNGTFVNGEPLSARHALADRDEIVIGRTRLVVRDESTRGDITTEPLRTAPPRTAGEQRVLDRAVPPVSLRTSLRTPPVRPRHRRCPRRARLACQAAPRSAVRRLRHPDRGRRVSPGPTRQRGDPERRCDAEGSDGAQLTLQSVVATTLPRARPSPT